MSSPGLEEVPVGVDGPTTQPSNQGHNPIYSAAHRSASTPSAINLGASDLSAVFDDPSDSSEDEDKVEDEPKIHRKLSASISKKCEIEGYLLKKTKSIQGWKKRWFALTDSSLLYSRQPELSIRVKLDIKGASVVEGSTKNQSNTFEVIMAMQRLILQASDRTEMEKWIAMLKQGATLDSDDDVEHNWYFPPASKIKYCQICGQLCSAMKRGMACEVCRLQVHTRCASSIQNECKWTAIDTIPSDCRTESGEIKHQWIVGNFGSNMKCSVCKKPCGSSMRLQDFQCLWCKESVHGICRLAMPTLCTLGPHRVSILSPTAIKRRKNAQLGVAHWSIETLANTNPLIVFVNPKSGSNDGVKVMRMFKRILNPVQVFDLSRGGPREGLILLRDCGTFRALGCGGDGTIGWILQEADKIGVHNLQLGVLPLGTGNDLGRVLGWGPSFDDDEDALSQFVDSIEKSKVKLLDRWSIIESLTASVSSLLSPSPTPSPLPAPLVFKTDATSSVIKVSNTQSHLKAQQAQQAQQLPSSSPSSSPAQSSPSNPQKQRDSFAPAALKAAARFSQTVTFSPDIEAGFDADVDLETNQESSMRCKLCTSEFLVLRTISKMRNPTSLKQQINKLETNVTIFLDSIHSGGVNDRDQGNTLPISSYHLKFRMTELQDTLKKLVFDVSKNTQPETWLPQAQALDNDLRIIAQDAKKFCCCATLSSSRERSVSSLWSGSREISVMNNYFGIGLDARITLDFNTMRTENPEKFRSRMKNQVWYGLLGGREMMMQSCKNLHQRLKLKCDGVELPLPRLQGIVILNIPSYMGGTNFWGTRTESKFRTPSSDDGIIEVVAVKSSSQMAASKVMGLTPQRLAQARSVQIIISEGEPIPIQVDGEAWLQSPATITIRFKNCAQMLSRDKEFQKLLLSWKAPESTTYKDHPLAQLNKPTNELIRGLEEASESHICINDNIVPICNRIRVLQSRLLVSAANPPKSAIRPSRSKLLAYLSTIQYLMQTCRVYIDLPFAGQVSPLITTANRIPLEEIPQASQIVGHIAQVELELSKAEKLTNQKIEVDEIARQFPHSSTSLPPRRHSVDSAGLANGSREVTAMAKLPSPLRGYSLSLEDPYGFRDVRSPSDCADPGDIVEAHSWTVYEVCAWAKSSGLGEVCSEFRKRKIGGRQLLSLQSESIIAFGFAPVVAEKLIGAVHQLNNQISAAKSMSLA